jgi:hypothetical protein
VRPGPSHVSGGTLLSTRTQAPLSAPQQHGLMLWSDPRDEPPREMRTAQTMLRRLSWVLPVAVLIAVLLTGPR